MLAVFKRAELLPAGLLNLFSLVWNCRLSTIDLRFWGEYEEFRGQYAC
jgi:hypothetical protein